LQYSKTTIPHFYVRQEINVEALAALREDVKRFERNLTINDFIIKATAVALKHHPEVNAGFHEERKTILRFNHIDIAVAVTIPGGLITPILHDADQKTIATISQEIKLLAAKAREGKLKPHEYQGGSFTISNLGMFGVTDFQAIINPPQAAILAIGTVRDTPVVKNGQIVPGKMLSATLSCDHRAIDGAEAAAFMQTLRQLLENPILFLSE
jgi:pyruvate dehydrogenase E2 component (dihydrolipoamide acetyltransferase)